MSEDIVRPGGSSPRQPQLRASDADREQLAGELRAHAVAGRIDTDELEERVQAAYSARTLGDLDELRRDLPATPEQMALSLRERRSQLVRRTIQETGGSLGLFAVCTAIWIGSGASGFFWPLFVVIGVIGLLLRNCWDLYGPAADLDAAEARLEQKRHRDADHAERHADHRERRAERRDRRHGG
ncbi:MAG TPA: DUF1707 domain-containing protein [Solirubrobacteraceae bacterium]|jgi:hypothetical protein